MVPIWVSVLLGLILLALVFLGIIIYLQSRKKKNEPADVTTLQQNIESSKELLKVQVATLERQLTEFKMSWTGSDKENHGKLVTLINNLENFQRNLDKKESDYKLNTETIKTQVSNVLTDLGKLQQSSTVLGKIDDNIQSLQEVFINTKKRGNAGEFVLEKILINMLGTNQKLWQRQYKTIDGKILDAYVESDEGKEGIAIDSKFSINNYQKYLTSDDKKIKENYLKDFRNDIRSRIDEVAKYINQKNKISSAVMFIPSEEIFAFIYAHFSDDIVEYAFKKHVWITSPTTLAAILFTIDKNRKDIEFNKNLEQMSKKLLSFKNDFDRWVERWEDVKKDFKAVNGDINDLDITHNKLAKHYNNILEMTEDKKESE